MTTEAALTKLAYLLALPDSTPESIARDMAISMRGELTSHSQPVFRHPDGALSERTTTLTALGYAIAQGDLEKVKDLLRGANDWVVNDSDYSGNTPVVSLLSLTLAGCNSDTKISSLSTLRRIRHHWRFFAIFCYKGHPSISATAQDVPRCF